MVTQVLPLVAKAVKLGYDDVGGWDLVNERRLRRVGVVMWFTMLGSMPLRYCSRKNLKALRDCIRQQIQWRRGRVGE